LAMRRLDSTRTGNRIARLAEGRKMGDCLVVVEVVQLEHCRS
jgi:hypothetical protein